MIELERQRFARASRAGRLARSTAWGAATDRWGRSHIQPVADPAAVEIRPPEVPMQER